MRTASVVYLVTLFSSAAGSLGAQPRTSPPEQPLYASIADDVYLQEIPEKFSTGEPMTAVAVFVGRVHVLVGGVLHAVVYPSDSAPTLRKIAVLPDPPSSLRRLITLEGALWCLGDNGVYRQGVEDSAPRKVFDAPLVDLCLHNGAVHGATREDVYVWQDDSFQNIRPETGWLSSDSTVVMEDGSQVLSRPVRLGPIQRLASYSGTLYLLCRGLPMVLSGSVFETEPVDWGAMPSRRTRDMLSFGSRLLIATDRGVAQLRGASLTTLEGLPDGDTTCLAAGFARDLWIGTTTGLLRFIDGKFHYFGADHWLPGDHVNDLAIEDGPSGKRVHVVTNGGLATIRYEPYTLRKKADYFERNVAAWGHKRLGFVHRLYRSGEEWWREISDNDGGHTAHYLAAMCFKYAVTGEAQARREALDSLDAMIWLQTITGTDGFFARSIWARGVDQGRLAKQGSGGLPAKWYESKDGRWFWKGDTSSDEVNAHFYSVSLAHDLVAWGALKRRAAEHLARISRHIIANGWVLRDMDGQPTRWGRWDPDYLLRPYGFEARGLNGMEAQTYMWTALQLTGDSAFRRGLDQLLEWRYHEYTVREKLTFPPESVVPWDDELAFRCFHPLLMYADDPSLRSIYLRGLERHWEVMRMQKIPYFNFVYGALTGNDCEAAAAVDHLRAWSLDTVSHSYRNSHRSDLAPEPGYTPYMGGTKAISPRESACSWGSRSALGYDGGHGGRSVTPPVGWLEDYWMGRYYGMIQAPTVSDPELLSVAPGDIKPGGAAAYKGPPRPALILSEE